MPRQIRQRARQACQSCHQKKRKCDGEEPCGNCSGYGYHCKYLPKHSGREGSSPRLPADNTFATSSPRVLRKSPTESRVEGVLELSKSRFVSASSAIAFPMILSNDLGATYPTRLHSYAWNSGTRDEPSQDIGPSVLDLIDWNELIKYSDLYFDQVNPVLGILDQGFFVQRRNLHWSGSSQSSGFDAIVCGVCALGSLFAGQDGCSAESKLIAHAKAILETHSTMHQVQYDHVPSWILRTIYLRMTTRPHVSWIASATTLHLCEAIGLHRELASVCLASNSNAISALNPMEVELRRRTFWTAWSLNHLFSYEYGRSPCTIKGIDCLEPSKSGHEHTHNLIQVVKILSDGVSSTESCTDALTRLCSFSNSSQDDFITLLSADAAFCIFRKLKLEDARFDRDHERNLLAIGKASLESGRTLAASKAPWWNTMGTPFHFVCILLAMNTSESLALLAGAMQTLQHNAEHLRTHMTREAVNTAQLLVRAAADKKKKELDFLYSAVTPEAGMSQSVDMFTEHPQIQQDMLPEWWQIDSDMYVNELLCQSL